MKTKHLKFKHRINSKAYHVHEIHISKDTYLSFDVFHHDIDGKKSKTVNAYLVITNVFGFKRHDVIVSRITLGAAKSIVEHLRRGQV